MQPSANQAIAILNLTDSNIEQLFNNNSNNEVVEQYVKKCFKYCSKLLYITNVQQYVYILLSMTDSMS